MYLVVNNNFQACHPYNNGFKSPAPDAKTPMFLTDEAEAKAFAEFMAKKHRDQAFGVYKLIGSARTVEPPVEWKAA